MRKSKPKVGDFIITNYLFTVNDSGVERSMDGLPAVIIQEENDKYLCRFGKGHSWTENYNDLFSDKLAYLLSEEEFDIDN